MKVEELTSEQEDMICDLPYHEKKLKEKTGKNKKKHKMFPINLERLDFILKKIGRKKLNDRSK